MPSGLRGRLRLAAGAILALALVGAAEAADSSLFSPEPDPVTMSCGGRCATTVYTGPRLSTPMANSSVDSFSNGRGGRRPLAFRSGARPQGFDAVEGTEKDPLLNQTYDLNFPKTVPVLGPR